MGIIEALTAFKDGLKFWETVKEDELAAKLRFGKFIRSLEPGIYWKWPVFETISTVVVTEQPLALEPISITTADGVQLLAGGTVIYSINSAYRTLYCVQDYDEMLGRFTQATILREIAQLNYDECYGVYEDGSVALYAIEDRVRDTVDRFASRLGIDVTEFHFTTLTKHRCITLKN